MCSSDLAAMGKEKEEDQSESKEVEAIENDQGDEEPLSEEDIKEIMEVIPKPAIKRILSIISHQTSMSISDEPPGFTKFMGAVGEKLSSEHLTLIFTNTDKSDFRSFLHSILKMFGFGLLVVVVIIAVIYILNMFKNDKEMATEIIKLGAILLGGLGGGFGCGYFIGRRKR